MIELADVTLRKAGKLLLDCFNWKLPDPGLYLLLGPNASGKSLICDLLAGEARPQVGNVLIDGDPLYRLLGGYDEPVFIARAEDFFDETETLEMYMTAALRNFGGATRLLETAWPVIEQAVPGGRATRLCNLAHSQLLLAQIALAALVPTRLAILDGHLTYFDAVYLDYAHGLLKPVAAAQERFILLTASRMARAFPDVTATFILGGQMPASLAELTPDEAVDGSVKAVRANRAIRIYTMENHGVPPTITSGKHYRVLSQIENGLRIELKDGLDDALEELRANGLEPKQLEWE